MRCYSLFCLGFFISLMNCFMMLSLEAKDLLTHIKARGVIKVCSEPGFVPFEMKDNKGNWAGYDYDLMKHFAKYLNVKLEMMDTKWDGIIPTLLSKKCDLIASSMAITPERQRTIQFTDPIFLDYFAFAVYKDSCEGCKGIEDFDKKGIKISIKTGSSSDIYLRKNIKHATIVSC
jgi:polar amino acid transport system substrate-binding protein